MDGQDIEAISGKDDLVLGIKEKPHNGRDWVLLTIQHILAMFVSCITVPLVINSGWDGRQVLDVAATIFCAGVGTLAYAFITGRKSPVVLASSFAYLGSVASGFTAGNDSDLYTVTGMPNYAVVMIGVCSVGVVYTIIAIIVKFCGTRWIYIIMPPVVIGPVVMVIGLSLASSAVSNLTTVNGEYNLVAILVGIISMIITSVCAQYGTKNIKLIPFLIGIAGGYVLAAIITAIGYYGADSDYCRLVNFDPIENNFKKVKVQSFLDYPKFMFLGMNPTTDGDYEKVGSVYDVFKGSHVATALLLFMPVSLATACEHISDHMNLSTIVKKNLLKDPGLHRTLLGDGVATAIGGLCSGVANTSYGENVAVIGVTKAASIHPILTAAIVLVVLSFFKPLMVVIQTIPGCVMGGISLILYGFIALSGIKMLINNKVDFTITKNIFVASSILISGIGGLNIHFEADGTTVTLTSTAVSLIIGIIMNQILREPKNKDKKEVDDDDNTSVEYSNKSSDDGSNDNVDDNSNEDNSKQSTTEDAE